HDDAMSLADRIMLMQAGRIIQSGSAEDLYRRPTSLAVARFFSQFNEVEGTVRDGRMVTPLGTFAAPGIADGRGGVACVRPFEVVLGPPATSEVRGRVVARHFLGEYLGLELAVAGLPGSISVEAPLATLSAPGDEIGL